MKFSLVISPCSLQWHELMKCRSNSIDSISLPSPPNILKTYWNKEKKRKHFAERQRAERRFYFGHHVDFRLIDVSVLVDIWKKTRIEFELVLEDERTNRRVETYNRVFLPLCLSSWGENRRRIRENLSKRKTSIDRSIERLRRFTDRLCHRCRCRTLGKSRWRRVRSCPCRRCSNLCNISTCLSSSFCRWDIGPRRTWWRTTHF